MFALFRVHSFLVHAMLHFSFDMAHGYVKSGSIGYTPIPTMYCMYMFCVAQCIHIHSVRVEEKFLKPVQAHEFQDNLLV